MLTLVTAVLGFLGAAGWYYALKSYSTDNTGHIDTLLAEGGMLSVVSIAFNVVLWICKKVFPHPVYIIVFRTVSFLFEAVMFAFVVMFWALL